MLASFLRTSISFLFFLFLLQTRHDIDKIPIPSASFHTGSGVVSFDGDSFRIRILFYSILFYSIRIDRLILLIEKLIILLLLLLRTTSRGHYNSTTDDWYPKNQKKVMPKYIWLLLLWFRFYLIYRILSVLRNTNVSYYYISIYLRDRIYWFPI